MFKKVVIGVGILLGGFVAYVASRPALFHYERSLTMKAPPQVPYDIVSDFHQWGNWSPWDKLDPNMTKTYSGPPTGVGSSYSWAGNSKVGEGSNTITSAQPPEKLVMKLEFKKPFEATNTVTFSFKPQGEETNVTWAMDGENGFAAKAFGVFMNMDKMIGADFERGLGSLKTLSETEAKAREEKKKAEAEKAAAPTGEAAAPTGAAPGAPPAAAPPAGAPPAAAPAAPPAKK